METSAIITLMGTLFSVGGVGYLLIKHHMERKDREAEAREKDEEYERNQRVNKQDWLTWLAEAKKEVESAKEEAVAARRDAEQKAKEMIDLIEAHRKEMADKDTLIARLQSQLNSQDAQLRGQSEEISVLRRELATWKSKAPSRKEAIKTAAKTEIKEELVHKLTD